MPSPNSAETADFTPPYHQYKASVMELFLKIALKAAISLRGVAKVISFVSSMRQIETPCWQTGRYWLQRLGLFKLQREKTRADDWIYLVDHTIQLGAEKCLAIVGIRQSCLPNEPRAMRYEDIEPILLEPARHSTKEVVVAQLEKAAEKTGLPRAIVSDGGGDLMGGVKLFTVAHPETLSIYDIKHKCALVLKAELMKSSAWENFITYAAKLNAQIQQTDLAALRPPSQRSKCRYLNVAILTKWAKRVSILMDARPAILSAQFDWDRVAKKFHELSQYREQIMEWQEMMNVTEQIESFVRTRGLYVGCAQELAEQLTGPLCPPAQRAREQLLEHIREQSEQMRAVERVCGSTEILESAFGKLKQLEQNEGRDGFTSMLLAFPALLSEITKDVVIKAMEMTRVRDIRQWTQEKFGHSIASKRKMAFACAKI